VANDPALRASDAERDGVAHALQEHYAAGRLTMEEFHDRLDAAYRARTHGELGPLLADLPHLDEPLPIPATSSLPQPGWGRRARRRRRQASWSSYLSANVVCWAIWGTEAATSGHLDGLWPLWVTVPWGAMLLTRRVHR